jgi:hypothetical protein
MFAAGGAYAAAWPRLLSCALDLVDNANGSGSEGDEDEAAEQQLNAIAGYVKRVFNVFALLLRLLGLYESISILTVTLVRASITSWSNAF